MAEFVIRLADERGHVQEQIQSAATAEELRTRFSQAGYYVYSVKPRGLTGTARKTKLETFLIFNQQFLTLIRAGMPILGSLEMLAKSQKNANFSGQLQNIAARVRTGESISNAFEAQGAFPLMYTTTLLAGERAGNLEEVLGRYMSFQRVALAFRKKLTASLIYPMLLITLVICLFIFLITFVVPQFAKLYDQIGTKLPSITLFMLALQRGGRRSHRPHPNPAAVVRQDLAEIPGGDVRAHPLHAAQRRHSPGAVARNGSAVDHQPADRELGDGGRDVGARRPGAGEEPRSNEDLSRAFHRDDRGRRIDRCVAADAEFGGRIF